MSDQHPPSPNRSTITGPVEPATSPWTPSRRDWRLLLGDGPRYRVDQLWQGLYQHDLDPDDITNLPKALRHRLASTIRPSLTPKAEQRSDDGETVKWLFSLPGGAEVETVLMHYQKRSTVCVSSQAGCAMGCGFCATGQAGYQRNLTVGEILEQIVAARRAAGAGGRRLSNVVFMGMGEPLANYDRVLEAVNRIIGDFGIGARSITISTVGLVPQMLRLAEEGLQVGLALSLHGANDELRTHLVPVNRRYPINELVAACQLFRHHTGRRVSLEWAMIDGVNDRADDVEELASVASRAQAHVNLIPLNPTPGWPTTGSRPERVRQFAAELSARGVTATVRTNRGTDIDAACGQLAGDSNRRPERGRPVRLRPRA